MSADVRVTRNAAGGADVACHALLRSEFDPADVAAEFAAGPVPEPLTRADALRLIDLSRLERFTACPPGRTAPMLTAPPAISPSIPARAV